MRTLKKMIDYAHAIIVKMVAENDIVVDATVGNGNDTLLLAKLVGPLGKVYGFDIQKDALEITKAKLEEENLNNFVELINDSHENISSYVHCNIKAAMFNLGYLPGGDEKIITNPNSTISAINSLLDKLEVGGIITIVIYYGHDGGIFEKNSVLNFASSRDSSIYAVQKIEVINNKNTPPILVVIEKIN